MRLAERDQVVDRLDGDRVELAGATLQVEAVADVFEHDAERRHAVRLEPGEVPIDGRQVAAVEQALQLGPGQGVVLADDQERLARPRSRSSAAPGASRTQGKARPLAVAATRARSRRPAERCGRVHP